jgi:hypothetical protein
MSAPRNGMINRTNIQTAFMIPDRSFRRKMSAKIEINTQMAMVKKNTMIIHHTTSQNVVSSRIGVTGAS